jgi:hypothetical protein
MGIATGKALFQSWNALPLYVNEQGNDLFLAVSADGVQCGAPTGGDKGNGTINAKAVYDDNTLLTCIPVQKEFLDSGTIDKSYWNNLVPEPAKRFDVTERIVTKRDPETGVLVDTIEVDRVELPTQVEEHPSIAIMEDLMQRGYDPRDPAKYCEYLYEHNSLPGMPTRADWVHNDLSQGQIMTRLWLAAELLAISYRTSHQEMESMKQRLAVLEAA